MLNSPNPQPQQQVQAPQPQLAQSQPAQPQQAQPTLPDWMQRIEDKLTEMQKMVRAFIMSRPACSVMVNMGGGKTLTTLSALTWLAPSGHILIVAPKTIVADTWPREIEDWHIPVNIVSLELNDKGKKLSRKHRLERYDKLAAGEYPPSIVLCGEALITDLIEYFAENNYDWVFPTVVLDEAQLFKGHNSLKFKALKKVRPHITRLIELTGTPMPKDIQDLWSQIYLLDGGEALGKNITEFRRQYCDAIPVKADVTTYKAKPNAIQDIVPRIAHLAIHSYNTELPLPDRIYEDIIVDLPDDVFEEYRTLSREMVIEALSGIPASTGVNTDDADIDAADDDDDTDNDAADTASLAMPVGEVLGDLFGFDEVETTISATQAASLRIKLLQVASGTVYMDELPAEDREAFAKEVTVHNLTEEPGLPLGHHTLFYADNRIAVNMHNEKITALIDCINNADSPVLVPYMYRSDKVKIQHCLRQAGIDVHVFDKTPDMIRTWNNRELDVLMLHPASAGHGLNLQHGGHHIVWYSLPDSLEHYQQTNARLYRPGQQHDVVIHRIMAKRTYDAKQPEHLTTKGIEQDRMLDGLHHAPEYGAANNDPVHRAMKMDAANRKAFARHQDGIEDRQDTRLVDPNYIAQMQRIYDEQHNTPPR